MSTRAPRRSRRPILVSVSVLAGAVLLASASMVVAQPTVSFAFTQYSVVEQNTNAMVALVISEPPSAAISVYVQIDPGTATFGDDFVSGTTFTIFEPGVADTVYASIQIYDDSVLEPPETILLSLIDGGALYQVGEPSAAVLTIVDDDSQTPPAHFEVSDDIPLDPLGRLTEATAPGTTVAVDVVIDTLPPGGAVVWYTSSIDGGLHALEFGGSTRQTLQVPAAAVSGGDLSATHELRLLNQTNKRVSSSNWFVLFAFLADEINGSADYCFACVFAYMYSIMRPADCAPIADICGLPCPDKRLDDAETEYPAGDKTFNPGPDLDMLRRYRDEILVPSTVGDYYVQLYHDLSDDLAVAVLQRPALIHRVAEAWDLWLPAVGAEVGGQGDSFLITAEMQAALVGVMNEFAEVGSPELGGAMADFQSALDLANITGLTASDLQTRIEDNSMSIEPASWGAVKSLFH